MRRTLAVVVLLAACHHKPKGPPPDCKALAPHMDAIMQTVATWRSDDPLPKRLERFQSLCEAVPYSEAQRQCIADAESAQDIDACMPTH